MQPELENQHIPPEIVAQGETAVQRYLQRMKHEGKQKLFEAKVLFVGYGFVGKTSLVKRLIHNTFDEYEQQTTGINIDHFVFSNPQTSHFRVNVWDFGGQEINYPTHQFFLTQRSVYLKVWEHRQYNALPNLAFLDYWLNIARLLGGKSPIIMVQNKIDERFMSLPQDEISEAFGIERYIDVSAKTGEGIDALVRLLFSAA